MTRKAILIGVTMGVLFPGSICLGWRAAPPRDPRIGRPRWAVMTATDPQAARIPATPTPTTIDRLLTRPRPPVLDGRTAAAAGHGRVAPVETTIWSVTADIVAVQHTEDGDYHLLLRGASGQMMVAELPDPGRTRRQSPFAAQITAARRYLVNTLQPGDRAKAITAYARIVGVGYFGRINPMESSAKNGVQLHPVLGLALIRRADGAAF